MLTHTLASEGDKNNGNRRSFSSFVSFRWLNSQEIILIIGEGRVKEHESLGFMLIVAKDLGDCTSPLKR